MSNIQLARNLKYLRKKNNLTQDDMVDVLNISRQAYSNYETMKRTPDLDTLILLSNFYHVNLNDLVLCNLSESYTSFEGLCEGSIPYKIAKNEKRDAAIYLSDEELEMILSLRNLSPENRLLIKNFIMKQ